MSTSKENNKAIENINTKILELLNDRGIIADKFLSTLSKITNLEKTIQFKLVKVYLKWSWGFVNTQYITSYFVKQFVQFS